MDPPKYIKYVVYFEPSWGVMVPKAKGTPGPCRSPLRLGEKPMMIWPIPCRTSPADVSAI